MKISPDAEDVLDALVALNGDSSLTPEDLEEAVNRAISVIGTDARILCTCKNEEFKRGFIIGYALYYRTNKDNLQK